MPYKILVRLIAMSHGLKEWRVLIDDCRKLSAEGSFDNRKVDRGPAEIKL
jgi:hypothetical protein